MSDGLFGNSAIPIEPNADMRGAAVAIRQIFLSYTQAGFTEPQALQLTISTLQMGQGNTE